MRFKDYRKHEVSFCSDVSKWADRHFEGNAALPFGSSQIEEYGRGTQKRSDLRFYERSARGRGKLALCGEVKLPGTPMGRSAFDAALMQDAYEKATVENCRYFFTWNVEELVVFDRSIWDAVTMHERCVERWELGLRLKEPADVERADVKNKLFNEFLPRIFNDLAEILAGRRKPVFREAPADFYLAVLESHLTGPNCPLRLLRDHLLTKAATDKVFSARLQQWMIGQQWNFDRNNVDSWTESVDRAARSMVYVLSNRILFYHAVGQRNALERLEGEGRSPGTDEGVSAGGS